jgi:hypothetical protein
VAHAPNQGSISGSVVCVTSCTSATGSFNSGTSISLTATGYMPTRGVPYSFAGWYFSNSTTGIEVIDISCSSNICTFNMPAYPLTAEALFDM